jgi:hypothetical protein
MFRKRKEPKPWGPVKLFTVLAATAVFTVAGIVSLGWSAYTMLAGETQPSASQGVEPSPSKVQTTQNPMEYAPQGAASEAAPALHPAERIVIPPPTTEGPAGVMSGFPQTAEGAVGQWAAIEQRVLQSGSLDVAREVHSQWVMEKGPSFEEWKLTQAVQMYLSAVAQAGLPDPSFAYLGFEPGMAMVQAQSDNLWALICVLGRTDVYIKQSSRTGFGLCAAMLWIDGRWMIGPGPEPADPPQVYPNSEGAGEYGWLEWYQESGE